MKKFIHRFKLEFVLMSADAGSAGVTVDYYSIFSSCQDFRLLDAYSDIYDLDYLTDCLNCTLNGMAVFLGINNSNHELSSDLVNAVLHDEILEAPFGMILRVRLVFDGSEELYQIPDFYYEELPFS